MGKLIADEHFKDGTLVVAPCNSPEQAPITFGWLSILCLQVIKLICCLGCAHGQQLIWQLLNSAVKGYSVAGDTDAAFLAGQWRAQPTLGGIMS